MKLMPRFGIDRGSQVNLSDMLRIDTQVSAANCVYYSMRKEKRKAFRPEATIVFVEKNMYNYNKLWSHQMDKTVPISVSWMRLTYLESLLAHGGPYVTI